MAEGDEVRPRHGDRLLARRLRGHEPGVEGEARIAADAEVVLHPPLRGEPVVVPPHRVEHRPAAHAVEPGHRVGVGVGEDVADVEGSRHGRRRGVDGEHLAPGGGAVEGIGAVRLPPGGPGRLEALQPGLVGDAGGSGRPAGGFVRALLHDRVTVPCVLQLHDTATGEVTPLRPREPGRVSLYVCGPTVYDSPHLGHGRFSLVFDVLRRYLIFTGLAVTYVSNITDIEDKIIERAAAQGISTSELTATYEAVWWEAMDALGVLRPDQAPHATAYVGRMVDLVSDLMARGVAYETGDGVYLSVEDVPGNGLLALKPLEPLRAGARVEADEDKRSPLDFALWKKAKPGEPSWESPWGPGRPGWHTECVVMSLDLLGDGFELHGGGLDLMFPHHENERAQAVATDREFARHWMHNGWVTTDGEKMSKSLGNFMSLTDLLDRSDARSYRLLVLRSHYRSPIEVTPDTIADAESGLAWLDEVGRRFDLPDLLASGPVVDPGAPGDGSGPAAQPGDLDAAPVARRAAATVALLCAALGLRFRSDEGSEVDESSAELVRLRDEARAAKDWARADALRGELESAGWSVEDGPAGTRIRRQ